MKIDHLGYVVFWFFLMISSNKRGQKIEKKQLLKTKSTNTKRKNECFSALKCNEQCCSLYMHIYIHIYLYRCHEWWEWSSKKKWERTTKKHKTNGFGKCMFIHHSVFWTWGTAFFQLQSCFGPAVSGWLIGGTYEP